MGLFSKKTPGNPSHAPKVDKIQVTDSFRLFSSLACPKLPLESQEPFLRKWTDGDGHNWMVESDASNRLEFTFKASDGSIKFSVELLWLTKAPNHVIQVHYILSGNEVSSLKQWLYFTREEEPDLPDNVNELACRVFIILQEYLDTQHRSLFQSHLTGKSTQSQQKLDQALSSLMGGHMISNAPPPQDGGLGRRFR